MRHSACLLLFIPVPTLPAGPDASSSRAVSANIESTTIAAGKQQVVIALTISDGWYVYANPLGIAQIEGIRTTALVQGRIRPKQVRITYPPANRKIAEPPLGQFGIYEGKVLIAVELDRKEVIGNDTELHVHFSATKQDGTAMLLPAKAVMALR